MSEKERDPQLEEVELEEIEGEPLPDRELMSIITPTPGEELWTAPVEKPGI